MLYNVENEGSGKETDRMANSNGSNPMVNGNGSNCMVNSNGGNPMTNNNNGIGEDSDTMRVAIGTAAVLGLARCKQECLPTTAHLLMPGQCLLDCAFCAQASSAPDTDRLSRIAWPEFELSQALKALEAGSSKFKRVCLQTINGSGGAEAILDYAMQIIKATDLPTSVDIRTTDMGLIDALFVAGADVVGLPLDAVTPQIYEDVRGGSFQEHLDLLEAASSKHPGRISTHIIVGLGESEKEILRALEKLHEWGVRVGLFALTTVQTEQGKWLTPPRLEAYRRIQAAKWLVENNHPSPSVNRAREIYFSDKDLLNVPGRAFQTSGCKDCNRPYYNERPGDVPFNYPCSLSREDYKTAMKMTRL